MSAATPIKFLSTQPDGVDQFESKAQLRTAAGIAEMIGNDYGNFRLIGRMYIRIDELESLEIANCNFYLRR